MASTRRVIADAGPLIALAKIDRLDVLQRLFGKVHITETVWAEVCPAASAPGVAALKRAEGKIFCMHKIDSPNAAAQGLDAGEASALALAKRSANSLLIMDDRAGRSAARAANIPIVGTAALLVGAEQRKFINSAEELILQLRANGYFIADSVLLKLGIEPR